MTKRIPITKARINLGEVVRQAYINKEKFIIEKAGLPVAAIIGLDDLEDYLELQDPKLKKQIRQSYQEYRAGKSRLAGDFITQLEK